MSHFWRPSGDRRSKNADHKDGQTPLCRHRHPKSPREIPLQREAIGETLTPKLPKQGTTAPPSPTKIPDFPSFSAQTNKNTKLP